MLLQATTAAVVYALIVGARAGTVWPKPLHQAPTKTSVLVDHSSFTFRPATNTTASVTLSLAFDRYQALIFRTARDDAPAASKAKNKIAELVVTVSSRDESLGYDTSEAYTLVVTAPTVTLVADTVYGALRGLETFSQLVDEVPGQGGEAVAYLAPVTKVVDEPRFQHRGLMIDTSRHFLPLSTILRMMDAMAWVKLNVLHWHIVDDNSFPMQSEAFPLLTRGAFTPRHVYTKADVARVVEYGLRRGIRVVPELDTPGHVRSWGVGYPDLLTQCYDGNSGAPSGKGPLNPVRNATYEFLATLFKEVATMFPDPYMHVGGDEVPFDCWASNPEVWAWMKAHGVEGYEKLEEYFESRLLELTAAAGKSYVVWQEIFDNGVKVLPDTVVHAWKGWPIPWEAELSNITRAGYRALLSAPWYLNYISYGEDWETYYRVEPLNFTGTPEMRALVMGGEVCMWGEMVDATNAIPRTWPRAAAPAERLWSPEHVRDLDDASERIGRLRCLMLNRGLPAEPATGPGFCPGDWAMDWGAPGAGKNAKPGSH